MGGVYCRVLISPMNKNARPCADSRLPVDHTALDRERHVFITLMSL